MQGSEHQDRNACSPAIPHFASSGAALTQGEREALAKRKGLCWRCGQKTHIISIFKRASITNDKVYKGVCIKCRPTEVVLHEYEFRNSQVSVPVVAEEAVAFQKEEFLCCKIKTRNSTGALIAIDKLYMGVRNSNTNPSAGYPL